MTERDTQRQIVDLLRRAGWLVCVTSQPTAARAQLVGLPDLIAFKHGVTFLIEVKAERGKLRPAQVDFYTKLAEHTGPNLCYMVARDVDEVAGMIGALNG